MVDARGQLPSPSASAWLIDLTEDGGPVFIVLRLDESRARNALARYLVDIGASRHTSDAERAVASARCSPVAVIW